ncbi:MAG TPA: NAD-dependent epimerase/dehydratase family protein [Steroidobacteraceae bacterium]|nr:NAD-dependent epimerase/dehydratase family protein [Steroidobacteraceae bacterium]
MTSSKRVLVTGAGGFIGRWSVAPLLAKGYEVHAVLSGGAANIPIELHGATVHVADLLDESRADALLGRVRPTHLLHFAWIATPGVYWQSPDNSRWLTASEHLLRRFRALGGIRAVTAGSCVEYDWSKGGVCEERSSPLADAARSSPYAAAKIALQKSLAEFAGEAQLSAAWGRIFFQYGPYEHPERLVPSVIRHLLMNQEALCTHGRQIRSFLHVADVGAAFAAVLDSEIQGPVNIGSGDTVALADLIERIALEIGRPDLVRLGARIPPTEEPPLLVPDIHRLRDEVHWRPRFTLDAGLSDTIAWWRGHLSSSRS